MTETQTNNESIDNKIIDYKTFMTLATVHLYEEAKHRMMSREILVLGGLAEKAEELENKGWLLAGRTYNGKVLENVSYITTIAGMKVLTEYIIAQTGKSITTNMVPEYHSV